MPSPINEKTLKHLAELARVELEHDEEEKLLKDLRKILGHFEELESLDTKNVEPMAGGTDLKNVFRKDTEDENKNRGAGIKQFPEEYNDYLKIPGVFEASE